MRKEQEEAKKALDELLCSVQTKAYSLGYEKGYKEGCKK